MKERINTSQIADWICEYLFWKYPCSSDMSHVDHLCKLETQEEVANSNGSHSQGISGTGFPHAIVTDHSLHIRILLYQDPHVTQFNTGIVGKWLNPQLNRGPLSDCSGGSLSDFMSTTCVAQLQIKTAVLPTPPTMTMAVSSSRTMVNGRRLKSIPTVLNDREINSLTKQVRSVCA
jgi:hypothetical protein